MTEDFFMRLCDVYGFAPSRALRELVEAAIGQAVVAERHACARLCDEFVTAEDCRDAIRARSQP